MTVSLDILCAEAFEAIVYINGEFVGCGDGYLSCDAIANATVHLTSCPISYSYTEDSI